MHLFALSAWQRHQQEHKPWEHHPKLQENLALATTVKRPIDHIIQIQRHFVSAAAAILKEVSLVTVRNLT